MGSMSPEFSAIPRGIYCPTITFFRNDGTEDIDLKAQEEHARFLIQSGIHGITIHGTTGESVMLSHAERNAITKTIASVRKSMNARTTLVIGCSAASVREIVRMCEDAKANGGQYALVLPPSYWAAASTPAMIEKFYNMVADKSPIPVIIYSFPAVTQGIDMNSDLLGRLSEHPNIAGVKLTCGNVGKLTRLTDAYQPETFSVFGGSTDWLIPGLIGKSCGAVTGLANTHPRSVVKLYNLFQAGDFAEAQMLQGLVSRAEWAMGNTGMNGTKYAVEWVRQHDDKILPRAPLMECDEGVKEWIRDTMKDLTLYERKLAGKEQFVNSCPISLINLLKSDANLLGKEGWKR